MGLKSPSAAARGPASRSTTSPPLTLGLTWVYAELPELEARCHEHLHYARPTVLAATEDPQGTRVLNLFARDWYQTWYLSGEI